MFGFRGGESGEIVTRKRAYMRDAQRRWPFITYFDASTIRGPDQLAVLISIRSGCTRGDAHADVRLWSAGKDF
jgi:hypothetical protein